MPFLSSLTSLVEFFKKWWLLKIVEYLKQLKAKQYNSTIILHIAQDNSVFFYLYLLEIKKIRGCQTQSILKMICPEASNVICYNYFAY